MADEVTVKRVDALNSNFPKRAGENAIVGPGPPGRDGNRPSDAIMGGGELLTFEKKKTDAKIGAIDAPEEIGKRLEVRFNSHETVERALSTKEVLFEGGAEKMKERGSVRGGGRRNAMKEGTRMGSFPNPDGSERKRARSIRVSMGAKEGLT